MNILLYDHEYPPFGGGAGIVTRALGAYLARAGHTVTVLTGRYGKTGIQDREEGIDIYRVRFPYSRPPGEFPSVASMASFVPFSIPLAWRLVKRLRIEVINSHLAFPAGIAGLTVSKLSGVPHVASFVGGDVYDPSRQVHSLARQATCRYVALSDRLTANNEELRRRVEALGVRKPIDIIPYGIDHLRFHPEESHRESDGKVIILSLCRLVPRKGITYLLQAMPQVVRATRGNVMLQVCGDGPLRPELEAQARNLGIAENVQFTGFIPPRDQVAVYNRADVFVLPALHEGFPISVLEAMSCGLAIVASKVGGIPDQVQGNGVLVPAANPDKLADALIRLADDAALRKQMAAISRERILSYFTWEKVGKLYEQLYAQAIS